KTSVSSLECKSPRTALCTSLNGNLAGTNGASE
ncbi:unnamed protein product, partial [marine sediment metagenome]